MDNLYDWKKGIHSTAIAILKKSEAIVKNTTAASKYIPRRPRISINWNPPFQTQIYLVNSKKWKISKSGTKVLLLRLQILSKLQFFCNARVVGSRWWVAAIFAFEKTGKTVKKSSKSDRWLLRYNFLSSTPSILVPFNRLWSGTTRKTTFLDFCHFSHQKWFLVTLWHLCDEMLAKSELRLRACSTSLLRRYEPKQMD